MPEEELFSLSPEQEESVRMIQQAILESSESGVPPEMLMFILLQAASEISILGEHVKSDFMKCANAIYDDLVEEIILERASGMDPIEE